MKPYDSKYDPLRQAIPANMEYAPSYWVASVGERPADDGVLTADCDAEVAIIGGGFTGLATAMFLAREHNIKAVVLEANAPGWGCTSRNGGQGHLAWGRLSRSQWVKRWGEEMACRLHRNTLAGFEVFRQLTLEIDCDAHGDGNLLIAHSRSAYRKLVAESDLCHRLLKYKTTLVSKEALHRDYVGDQEAHGALLEPLGIGVHPLKLAYGYLRLARQYGACVHSGSPVTDWRQEQQKHILHTPQGVVRAQQVVVATAGYTHARLHRLLAYRHMPIMANSAVTRPLTAEEVQRCNLKTPLIITDTRKLRYYYRFLPDSRLQIGTRSAISGKDADNPIHQRVVETTIARKFPPIAGIPLEFFWTGWMDISHDMMPRIVRPSASEQIYYAQGYSGNGVAFSAYAAKELATLVAGKTVSDPDLPVFTSPLPTHPLRPLRRFGQHLLYRYFSLLDTLP